MEQNPDKKYICTGDLNQTEAIGYKGRSNEIAHNIKILFPNELSLSVNKRMASQEDRNKLAMLKEEIFSCKDCKFMKILRKYGFNIIDKYEDVQTVKNIAFYRKTCDKINNHVHYNILKNTQLFVEGATILVSKFFKIGKVSFNTNIAYKIVSLDENNAIIEDIVENNTFKITLACLNKNFKLPYCMTVDSAQGTTIPEKITIFNVGSAFVNAKYLWTMITRATSFENVTIFKHSADELTRWGYGYLAVNFSQKIPAYKEQDAFANRIYNDNDYITPKWFIDCLQESLHCKYCAKLFTVDDITTITANRIDNSIAHTVNNCELCCLHCNQCVSSNQ